MTSKELDNLILNYRNGDINAFDDIYYETQTSVYLSIRVFITKKEIIEELMQDTYVKAINNLEKYKIGSNFKAWISCVARNIAINYYNHEKVIEIKEVTDPAFICESKESKLNYYLSFLEGLDREIVIYHIVLDMKFKEIAEIINQPLSSVFLIYKKAIEKIKKNI